MIDLGRAMSVRVPPDSTKEEQVSALQRAALPDLPQLLNWLTRDELRSVCRAHGLDDSGRARRTLATRIAQMYKPGHSAPPPPESERSRELGAPPVAGDLVLCRQRQYLVEEVVPPPEEFDQTLVRLICLDDDHQGHRLDVLWELELGARVLHPTYGLGKLESFDPPDRFAAYLHALKWHGVTATDAKLFQAPFRAGIQLMAHQLTPLKKALALPRANLFIADDVGLGKTIEAGLVLQELLLRQQVQWCLIVCPSSVVLQWRDEMQKRFGLRFEVMSRAFVNRRRQERGFAVNPWSTHTRFIIGYPLLRRPEYRDPLLNHLGDRVKKSLLILDEAHTAAPATATRYAVDSRVTKVIRDVAPRFENRLFLSATPHNGHSNSFSALLELLDPQRFTRGVPISGPQQLDAVMVRRLKEDLRELGSGSYPERRIVRIGLNFDGKRDPGGHQTSELGEWTAGVATKGKPERRALGSSSDAEVLLSELLAKYTALCKPKRGRGKLVFINLQKRLLSSVEAFYRTLRRHAETAREDLKEQAQLEAAQGAQTELFATRPSGASGTPASHANTANSTASHANAANSAASATSGPSRPSAADRDALGDDDEYGVDDDVIDATEEEAIAAATRTLPKPSAEALTLLERMLVIAEQNRSAPDAKCLALLDWMRENQCASVQLGGARDKNAAWSDRRVIIFTEYGDTKRFLLNLLSAACINTARGDERIVQFHGGMSDEAREAVQRVFNAPPGEHPARILIATDAAREGINLQAHCADLFHYDIPWNPARMEQRNGRIDRTLQPEPVVRCHYFAYEQRTEDRVLEVLVDKVHTIQRELGSLAAVVMDRLEDALSDGITDESNAAIDRESRDSVREVTTKRELEGLRGDLKLLSRDIEDSAKLLQRSRTELELSPVLLKNALDMGCRLAGAPALQLVPASDAPAVAHEGKPTSVYRVPDLGVSWQETLDTLRPPRERDETFWDWRKRPPLPVVFEAPDRMTDAVCHLHLEHPFVKRVLSRFLAQGYSVHDLSRVTVVKSTRDALARVLVFGRLSLFGPGAARLHDRLVCVAAEWKESESPDALKPFSDKAERRALEQLDAMFSDAPPLSDISETIRTRLLARAPKDFSALWRFVEAEADATEADARAQLGVRGSSEAEALRKILEVQRRDIVQALEQGKQRGLEFTEKEKAEREQFEQDQKHLKQRLESIDSEITAEPEAIETLYRVEARRLEPVGLVYLWPSNR